MQILCRRSKNNPLYVGDPGVGKTAIAEGLALRIIDGDVPESLRDKRLKLLETQDGIVKDMNIDTDLVDLAMKEIDRLGIVK